jgi:hypothetical protein
MTKSKKTKPSNERVIPITQYQQVIRMSHPRVLTEKFPTLEIEKLERAVSWLQECDRQKDETLTFEVNPAEPLDQKLMGWRYFNALNAIRKVVEATLADRTMAAVFEI